MQGSLNKTNYLAETLKFIYYKQSQTIVSLPKIDINAINYFEHF